MVSRPQLMVFLPFLLSILSLTQLVNITHMDGIKDDLSNLILQSANGSVPYTVVGQNGSAAVLNASSGSPLQALVYGPDDTMSPDVNPQIFTIAYFDGLNPDFSNLVVELQSPSGSSEVAGYSVISESDGEWIIIGLDSIPPTGDTLKVLASVPIGGSVMMQNKSVFNSSSGYIGIDTFIKTTVSKENNVSIPSGYEDIDQFMNQSNMTNVSSNATIKMVYENQSISRGGSIPAGYENIDDLVNSTRQVVNGSSGYTDIDTFLNTTPQGLQNSFAAIIVGSHARGSRGLIPISFNGSSAEISGAAYDMLAGNSTVRLIVEGGGVFPNMSVVRSIPSRGIKVLTIDRRSLAQLLNSGASKIYLDTPVQEADYDSIPLMRADSAAAQFNLSGDGVTICLLDTGVDYNASQFGGKVLQGYDFVNNEYGATDDNGHGTFIASVIHSIAPGATIIPVKVLDSNGNGYSSDIISGIDYCMQAASGQSVQIISMSFGGGNFTGYCDSDPLAMEVESAYEAGILPVASSGNGGGDGITLPACAMNATAVASSSESDSISNFSNINGMVDLLAPGEDVTADGLDGVGTRSGTSISAADVSGAAALLLQSDPTLGPDEITQRFRDTGIFITDSDIVYPRIDVLNAVLSNITGIPEQPVINEYDWNSTVNGLSAASWSNTSFNYCENVIILNASTTSMTNFPALVILPNNASMLANYADLRFYNASCNNGGSILPYEIENYTATNATIWVGIPTLNAANTTISLYFGNNTPVSSGQNATGVWDPNFMGVWHLKENPAGTAPQINDSTSNGNAGTATGLFAGNQTAGQIDGSLNFTGSNASNIVVPNSASIDITGSQLSISAWVRPTNVGSTTPNGYILVKSNSTGASGPVQYGFLITNTSASTTTGEMQGVINNALRVTSPIGDVPMNGNTWTNVAFTYDGANTVAYVNGLAVNTTAFSTAIASILSSNVTFGMKWPNNNPYTGSMDELELSNVSRSAQWINQSYQMENNNSAWVKFGPFQSQPVCPIITTSGVYNQSGNYINAPNNASPLINFTCVKIAASNVTYNCNGFNITNNATVGTTYGILVNGSLSNVTIQNCPLVTNYSYGIYVYQSNASAIVNSTAYNDSLVGIDLNSSSNCSITNSTGFSPSGYGLYLNVTRNSFFNNSIGVSISGYGLSIQSSSNFTLINSTGTSNSQAGIIMAFSSNETIINSTGNSNSSYGIYLVSNSNGTITNSLGNSNTSYGFFLNQSNSNNLTGDVASNDFFGFYLFNSSFNQFFNNSASIDTDGFIINSSSNNNTLVNNTASSNSNIGLLIYDSNLTAVQGMHFFNNSPGLEVQDDQGSSFIVNLTNMVFDNPLGNFQNYTNLSINDSLNTGETYSVKWMANQTVPPYTSFAQTYVNITTIAGTVSMNSVVWTWISGQLTGYNSSLFQLWNYNATGWTMLNNTPNTVGNTLSLFNLAPQNMYAILQVSNCPIITSSGVYNQTNNFIGAPNNASPLTNSTCVKIAASNVTYNCNGFNITNNATVGTTYGILVNGSLSNVTIQNCPLVTNYSYGIYVYQSNASAIVNSTAYNDSLVGIDLNSSSNCSITNSTGFSPSGYGLYLNVTRNSFFNNSIGVSISGYGLSIQSSSNFTLINSTGTSNSQAGIIMAFSSNETIINSTGNSNSSYGIYLVSNSNGTITNSLGNSNTSYGFFLNQSNSNNLTGDVASNDFFGFYLFNSSFNQFFNNSASIDTDGFIINSSSNNNTLVNNTASSNSNIGLLIYDSNLTAVQGMHFFNNSPDLEVQNDLATSYIINLTSMVFDNPLGNYQNYTNLSINDSVSSGDNYSIKWTTSQSTPPYTSFAQTYVNITTISGTPSIDSIVWSWISGQLTGYNSSLFQLWNYNATGWTVLNSTPDTIGNTLKLSSLSPQNIYAILQVSKCPIITSSGVYNQTNNYIGAPNSASTLTGFTCVKIAASNVTYNCNGFNITNNATAGTTYGILLNGSLTNVTIKNCPGISNYSAGIYIYLSNNNVITNSTAYNNTQYGFFLTSSSSNNITNSTAFNNTNYGFYISSGSNNTITNSTAYNNPSSGISVSSSSNNTFTSNFIYNNPYGFVISSSSNNIFTNNSVYSNPTDFYITSSSNNIFTNNSAYNSTQNGFLLSSGSNNNILTGNSAYSNANYGFFLSSSSNNTLTNNSAYSNPYYGFYLFNSSNNTITNSTAYNNTLSGFYLSNSSNNTILNSSAYSNFHFGLLINDSNLTAVQGIHFYNNSPDLEVQNDLATPYIINLTSMVFDNPLGNYQNYTNLSINDSVSSGDNYSIKWTTSQSTPPYTSFAQTYVNITTISGTPSIDSIVWSWISGQLTGYNSSLFQLWNYNATGWTVLNSTPDTIGNTLKLSSLSPQNIYAILQVSKCPIITSSGVYNQTNNYIGAPNSASTLTGFTCVKIAASNVTYNCNGFNITNNATAGTTYGILLNGSLTNVTIKNCPGISNYSAGIYIYLSNNNVITNSTAYNNTQYGFFLTSSSSNNITNSTAFNNTNYGFYISSGSNNTITNSTAYNNPSSGISVSSSSNNTFTNKFIYNNPYGFVISSSSNNTFTNNSVYSNPTDFYITSTSNNNFTNNSAYNSTQNGFLLSSGSNNNILTGNSAYSNANYGFFLSSSSNNTLTNNSAYNNSYYGFYIFNSSNNTITNSTAYNNTLSGFYHSNSSNNSIVNNSAYSNFKYGPADIRFQPHCGAGHAPLQQQP